MNRQSVLCGALLGGALIAPAQQGLTLQVQLHTGSGAVDATHKIFVALWDSADFNGAPPTCRVPKPCSPMPPPCSSKEPRP